MEHSPKYNKIPLKSQFSPLTLLTIREVAQIIRRPRLWIQSNLREFETETRLLYTDKNGISKYQIFFTLHSVEAAVKRWITPNTRAKTARKICQDAMKE